MQSDSAKRPGPLRPHVSALYKRMFPKLYVRHLAKFYMRREQELVLLPLLIKPGETAVDVGAHAGAYIWHLLNITDHVEAFEPNSEFARLFAGARLVVTDTHIIGKLSRLMEVAIARLDQFNFSDVGFIKVDVEGHELSVLLRQPISYQNIDQI